MPFLSSAPTLDLHTWELGHTHTHSILVAACGSRYQEEGPLGIQKKADGLVALEFSFIFESINAGATR